MKYCEEYSPGYKDTKIRIYRTECFAEKLGTDCEDCSRFNNCKQSVLRPDVGKKVILC